MGQNLTGQLISATYESLVQISGSIITDGTGSDITSLDITASNAISALSANSASVATSASFADTSTSSSYALTASFALNAGAIDSGSFMITGSVSSNTLTFEKGDGSTFSLTVDTGSAVTVDTGSFYISSSVNNATITFTQGDGSTEAVTVNNVSNASTASIATSATSATTASAVNTTPASDGTAYDLVFVASQLAGTQVVRTDDNGNITFNPSTGILAVPTLSGNATTATSASHALNADNSISSSYALTASYAENAGTTVDTGSLLVTASISDATITFTKGDASTFGITVNNVQNASTASIATTAETASYATNFTASNILVTGLATVASASIAFLEVIYETASVIYSSGSNQFGDASDDVQTLYGTVDVKTGPLLVTGSVSSTGGFTGSLQGTATNAVSSSYALTASYLEGGIPTPNLQEVTTAGAITSESIQITDGIVANATILGTGNAITLNSIDGTTAMAFDFADASAMNYGGMGFDPATSIVNIYANGGTVKIENDTQVTGSLNISGGASGSFSGSFQGDGSGLTGVVASAFPFTGDASITGDLSVTGSYLRLSGSFSGSVIDNITDVYTSTAAIEHVISLTQAEYNAISSSADPNTLYYITDAAVVSDFPYTGSAQITGSLYVVGPVGIAGNVDFSGSQGKFIGGWVSRGGSYTNIDQIPTATTIVSSTGNGTFNSGQTYNFLGANSGFIIDSTFGSANALIAGVNSRLGPNNNVYTSAIIAGQGNQIVGGNAANIFLGGVENCVVENDQNYFPGAIIGARAATIKSQHTGSVILGGNGLQTTGPGQVVVPKLLISGSGGGITFPDGTTQSSAGLAGVPTFQEVTVAGAITDQTVQFTDTTTANATILGTGNAITLNSIDGTTPMAFDFADASAMNYGGMTFDPATSIVSLYANGGTVKVENNTEITGSLRGNVSDLTISSNTASLDLATGNFFTLQLVPGSNTFINPSNISPGQTINLKVNTTGSATVSFPSTVKQVSGSAYVPTTTTGVDIVTFISFDSTDLYLSNVKNLV